MTVAICRIDISHVGSILYGRNRHDIDLVLILHESFM
jgi:hypothetical protein